MVQHLLDKLAGGDSAQRQAACQELVEAGESAVAPLVATLLDEQSPVGWSDAGGILRRIGRPAFQPLVDAIAIAPTDETRRRCAWAFMGFGAELVDLYAGALRHPSPDVRQQAALGIQYCREAGLPALPAMLPLLADPSEDVRQRVTWALAELGEGSVPALQRIRSDGPGWLRAGALRAIAEVAGQRAFSEADLAAVRRLIRIKLRTETAEAIDGCGMCGSWLALPTGDQQEVMAALDLSDPQPATMRLGFAAFYRDGHGASRGEQRKGRVFVTPRLDGWTLVLGAWDARWRSAGAAGEIPACRRLSQRFGKAQAYTYDAQTGEGSWVICEGGEVVRAYDQYEPKNSIGPRLPVEQGLVLSLDELTDEEFESLGDDYESADALQIAAAMSVAPDRMGPETEVDGHGMLAMTTFGRTHGVPPGALPI